MDKLKKTKMKLRDYIRLGRISIKSRKKSTKNTVFGMAFGLILLVPMIFFAVAFYTDLSSQINSIRTASECKINLKNINDKTESTPYKEWTSTVQGQMGMPAYSLGEELIAMNGVEDYILSEYANMPFIQGSFNDPVYLTVDGENYNINPYQEGQFQYDEKNRGINLLKIIYTEESSKSLFTDAELADYKALTNKNNPLLSVCNDGFSDETKGKNEIILSEPILKKWGIDKDDIAGKKIRIANPDLKMGDYYLGRYTIDNDYDYENEYVYNPAPENPVYKTYFCYDYTVVGIIDSEYYDLPGKRDESHIWVTSSSVYYEDGSELYNPINYYYTISENNQPVLTFADNISVVLNKNINEQYMLLMQNLADRYVEEWSNNKMGVKLNQMTLKIQFKDYETASVAVPEMKNILKDAYTDMTSSNFTGNVCNEIYVQFDMLDQVGKIIILVFAAIGGIIFFTNMLNLLNTVRYSVESRKNYIGVMRAIGAKSRIIPKMYIFEMLIIFFRTFIWTAIFSSLISYGIKYGLDKAFSYLGELLNFKINFLYYPIALGGAFTVTILIGTFFAYISSKVMAYQPILKTLFDEK